jgi:hypothetical protein
MEHFEMAYALSHLTLLVDTREQPTQRAKKRIDATGLPYERTTLSFGDYAAKIAFSDGSELALDKVFAVERKMNLDEICACFTHERKRFVAEFERAKEAGARLYLLIENADMEKAVNGRYRSKMNPTALVASLFAWMARYDCRLIMCKEETSGRMIREIMLRETKEYLERMEDNAE